MELFVPWTVQKMRVHFFVVVVSFSSFGGDICALDCRVEMITCYRKCNLSWSRFQTRYAGSIGDGQTHTNAVSYSLAPNSSDKSIFINLCNCCSHLLQFQWQINKVKRLIHFRVTILHDTHYNCQLYSSKKGTLGQFCLFNNAILRMLTLRSLSISLKPCQWIRHRIYFNRHGHSDTFWYKWQGNVSWNVLSELNSFLSFAQLTRIHQDFCCVFFLSFSCYNFVHPSPDRLEIIYS